MRVKDIVAAIHSMPRVIVCSLIALLVFMNGCTKSESGDIKDTKVLNSVEIKQYQGKYLSSINDFRENSIKGPQYIDIEKYQLNFVGLIDKLKSYTYKQVIDEHQSYKKVVKQERLYGFFAGSAARTVNGRVI